MGNTRILVVDDDRNICELLKLYLTNEGFEPVFAYDGSAALSALKDSEIALVLLDVMLPVINGWEVLRMIRNSLSIPVIMLTARDMVEDKLQGFEIGADDYIVKPFEPREVMARIKVRLKAHSRETGASEEHAAGDLAPGTAAATAATAENDNVLTQGGLTVDLNTYEVRCNGQLLELKPKEIQLLYFFLCNKNIVFSRDQLLQKVWDYTFSGDTRTVDVHIKRLREKLEGAGAKCSIKTIWSVGYKLEV